MIVRGKGCCDFLSERVAGEKGGISAMHTVGKKPNSNLYISCKVVDVVIFILCFPYFLIIPIKIKKLKPGHIEQKTPEQTKLHLSPPPPPKERKK